MGRTVCAICVPCSRASRGSGKGSGARIDLRTAHLQDAYPNSRNTKVLALLEEFFDNECSCKDAMNSVSFATVSQSNAHRPESGKSVGSPSSEGACNVGEKKLRNVIDLPNFMLI